MDGFEGGDGGLAPLAGAAEDSARSGEDCGLMGVGCELEGAGEFEGVGRDTDGVGWRGVPAARGVRDAQEAFIHRFCACHGEERRLEWVFLDR